MQSLAWSTLVDVLPVDKVVERRGDHVVVRSPSNPSHYWGNLLLFDDAPAPGQVEEWERLFVEEVGDLQHRTFAWDRTDGERGAAQEFLDRGYDLELGVGLVSDAVREHPRANRDVRVLPLDPEGDEELWDALLELEIAERDEGHGEDAYRTFIGARLRDRRALFAAGHGTWYLALDGDDLAGSLGIVVTDGRARYQSVITATPHHRRGIATRLLTDAARHAAKTFGARQFVIVADPNYYALGLYESLGFERVEEITGVCRWPRT